MDKVCIFAILCLYLGSSSSRTFPNETEQETLNRVSVDSDTIFKGRILRIKQYKMVLFIPMVIILL